MNDATQEWKTHCIKPKPINRTRVISSMEWMVTHFKWSHDETGIEGNYSPELLEAIAVLEDLKAEAKDGN